jgi:hypothetical protein
MKYSIFRYAKLEILFYLGFQLQNNFRPFKFID